MSYQSDCAICCGTNNRYSITLPCGHRFHSRCLDLLNNYSICKCPYCRENYDAPMYCRLRSKTKYFKQLKSYTDLSSKIRLDFKNNKISNSELINSNAKLVCDIFNTLNKRFRIMRFHLNKKFCDVVLSKLDQIESDIELEDFESIIPSICISLKQEIKLYRKKCIDIYDSICEK